MKQKVDGKKKLTLYLLLRILVVVTLVRQIFLENWNNVFLCVLTLVLFLLPSLIEKRMNITLPSVLEGIILLFIFSAEILGEINNFYGEIPHWDTMLHTMNGFLCAAIGFSLIDILNRNKSVGVNLSPLFIALVAFCFSMTIGVLWEFFEFTGDQLLSKDMQKDRIIQKISTVELNPEGKNIEVIIDNIKQTDVISVAKDGTESVTVIKGGYLDIGLIDTMKDLIVNFIGAIVFSILGTLYIKNRDKYAFAGNFIPKSADSEQQQESDEEEKPVS